MASNKTLTFVYICRRGLNEELRYSIRSVMHFFPKATVWIVGEAPDWYTGNLLSVPQNRDKYSNATKNLEQICSSDEIPEDFIYMNDDFYIIKDVGDIGFYHGGPFLEKYRLYNTKVPTSSYTRRLGQTLRTLRRIGIKDGLDYELHVPIPINKQKLKQAIAFNVLWRSMYGNINNVGGEEIEDVKVYFDTSNNPNSYDFENKDSPFLSTEDRAFQHVKGEVLSKLFPHPSKYEKPVAWNEKPRCRTCGHLL
jgi:hypothetical protein